MAGLGRWLYWLGGCAILAYMGWNLIWSDHGYLVYRQEAAKLQQLQQQVAGLRAARERLASEVLRLRNDPEALEELIHRELGYVHPDEYMVMMGGREASGVRRQGLGVKREGLGVRGAK